MSEKAVRVVLKKGYFEDGFNGSVEQVVNNIGEKLPNKNDRIYRPELFGSYEVASIEEGESGGIFVRIHSPEENSIGLMNQEVLSASGDLEEHNPPENRRFLSEEIILFIKSNHILGCNIGNRDGTIQNILITLAEKAGIVDRSFKMCISDVPNQVEVNKAKEYGVKEINLGINGYLASVEGLQHESKISKIFKGVFGVPDTKEGIKKRDGIRGRLVLTRSYRFKAEEIHKDEWLTNLGEEILASDADDYTLVLEDGTKISTNKLKVSKTVKLKQHANTISYTEAKSALLQYYKELEINGSLEW